eukprot:6660285-Pyramimonas_sp.AAC.1
MLLVSRIGKSNSTTWTACGPSLRVQVINVRDKERVFTKPVKDLTWTEHPGLSAASRDRVLAASERLIARRELEAEDAKTAIPAKGKQQKKRKPSKKSDLFSWVQGGVMNAVSFLWLRRSAGGSLAMCFLGWRAWRVLGLGSVLQTVYESVLAAGE